MAFKVEGTKTPFSLKLQVFSKNRAGEKMTLPKISAVSWKVSSTLEERGSITFSVSRIAAARGAQRFTGKDADQGEAAHSRLCAGQPQGLPKPVIPAAPNNAPYDPDSIDKWGGRGRTPQQAAGHCCPLWHGRLDLDQSLDLGRSCSAPNSSHSFSLSSKRAEQPYHSTSCNPFTPLAFRHELWTPPEVSHKGCPCLALNSENSHFPSQDQSFLPWAPWL